MRQGLFPICIVCAVTAASSRKNFDKPSIATEKSFCNSKGVHSRSKQGLRIYKDHFALQNACWKIPNPWTASDGCRLRVFAKRFFRTPQECAAITERDVHRDWDCIPTSRTRTANFQCRACFLAFVRTKALLAETEWKSWKKILHCSWIQNLDDGISNSCCFIKCILLAKGNSNRTTCIFIGKMNCL